MNKYELLTRFIESRRAAEFDWVNYNCGQFVAEWAQMIEPGCVKKDLRFPNGLNSVVRSVKKHGDLSAMVTSILHREPISALYAQPGDVVLAPGEIVGALGICNGRTAIFMKQEGGLTFADMPQGNAWAIGRIA